MRTMVGRWYDHEEPFLLRIEAELDHMIDRMRVAPDYYNHASLWVFHHFRNDWPVPCGPVLKMGIIGDRGSFFIGSNHGGSHYPPGSWYSLGDPNAPDEDVLYMAGDGDSEYFYPAETVVSLERIRAAVHEFARTGERPTAVHWQDWRPPFAWSRKSPDYDPANDPWAAIGD